MAAKVSQGPLVEDTVNHFRKDSRCAKVLSVAGVVPFMPISRHGRGTPDGMRSRDQLFSTSLNNETAVPFILGVFQDPGKENSDRGTRDILGLPPQPPKPSSSAGGSGGELWTLLIPSVTLLSDLRPGVNGFHGSTHGGFMAALIDEAMGTLLFLNRLYQQDAMAKGIAGGDGGSAFRLPPGVRDMTTSHGMLTASMTIRLQNQLPTPSIAATTAFFNRLEGRKMFLDVLIHDLAGKVYARAEGMWIAVPLSALGKPKM